MGYYLLVLERSAIPNIIPPNPDKLQELSRGLYQKLNKKVELCQKLTNHEQLFLGALYKAGIGCEKNVNEAARWLRVSADEGNAVAQCDLGLCYEKGEGVSRDLTEAVKYYRLSADQGNATAQCNLGLCYENGEGVSRDMTEAVKYYRLSADQGYASCSMSSWIVL